MVSVEQISALIDRLEDHPGVALGQSNRSKEGRNVAKRFWVEAARILNHVSPDCHTKSPDQWRLYYNEYKSKVVKKVKIEKQKVQAAGGGVCKVPLTPLQKRLYTILKRDGWSEKQKPTDRDPLFQYKVLKAEVPEDEPAEEETVQVLGEAQNGSPEQPCQDTQPLASTSWGSETVLVIPAERPRRRARPRAPRSPAPAAPRVRRRCAQVDTAEHRRAMREVSELYRARLAAPERCSVREATRRLEALERLRAAATREAARATLRLASALEALAQRLRDPIVVVSRGQGETSTEAQAKTPSRTSSESD